ncbi:hypothetical protein GCM10010178_55480 [Lentzea flava]|uniref:Uncharacterized protein n=1 Tax=Lentzea flava TaxID=103732 RepID=A0ABQ2UVH1_9PSEU|nr:hypothetical protein GCM10010178_55480 [Lentzea flava]
MVVGAADEEEEVGVAVVEEVVGAEEDDDVAGLPTPVLSEDVCLLGAAALPVPNWFAASVVSFCAAVVKLMPRGEVPVTARPPTPVAPISRPSKRLRALTGRHRTTNG